MSKVGGIDLWGLMKIGSVWMAIHGLDNIAISSWLGFVFWHEYMVIFGGLGWLKGLSLGVSR